MVTLYLSKREKRCVKASDEHLINGMECIRYVRIWKCKIRWPLSIQANVFKLFRVKTSSGENWELGIKKKNYHLIIIIIKTCSHQVRIGYGARFCDGNGPSATTCYWSDGNPLIISAVFFAKETKDRGRASNNSQRPAYNLQILLY